MTRNSRFRTTSGSSSNRHRGKPGKDLTLGKKILREKNHGFVKTKKEYEHTSTLVSGNSPIRKGEGKKPYPKFSKNDSNDLQPKKLFKGSKKRIVGRGKSTPLTNPSSSTNDGLIRLNKYISNSGVCSRREADDLISSGLVTVNGKHITELGYKVNLHDNIRCHGERLKAEKLVYVLLNKPKGYITTTKDPQERKTVMGLIKNACKERVYPVGRLDRNTSGVLLITNDGALTDRLTHPSFNAKKIYKIELDRPLTKNDSQKIIKGVYLEEGKVIVDNMAVISSDGKTIGLEIHIGWNRVVRRVFEALGYTIIKLDRSVFATLDKKDLPRGNWRFLRQDEVIRIKHFI